MSAVDVRLGQIQLSSLPQVFGERREDPVQDAFALPLLKAVVACLGRRIPSWQVRPGRSGAQDPEDRVQHVPRISPWPTSTRCRALLLRIGNAAANRCPLLVREVHRRRYKHLLRPMEIPFRKMEQSRSLAPRQGYRMRSKGRTLRARSPRWPKRNAPRLSLGDSRSPGGDHFVKDPALCSFP